MPNIDNIISSHNKFELNNETQNDTSTNSTARECNCRQQNSCPLSGKCLTEGIVYQATVTTAVDNRKEETYVGLTEGTFKTLYANHTSSFRNPKQKCATELSKYIWSLESNTQFSVKWRIIKRCKPYSNLTKRSNLCLYKKFVIIWHPELCLLNSRMNLYLLVGIEKNTY